MKILGRHLFVGNNLLQCYCKVEIFTNVNMYRIYTSYFCELKATGVKYFYKHVRKYIYFRINYRLSLFSPCSRLTNMHQYV